MTQLFVLGIFVMIQHAFGWRFHELLFTDYILQLQLGTGHFLGMVWTGHCTFENNAFVYFGLRSLKLCLLSPALTPQSSLLLTFTLVANISSRIRSLRISLLDCDQIIIQVRQAFIPVSLEIFWSEIVLTKFIRNRVFTVQVCTDGKLS